MVSIDTDTFSRKWTVIIEASRTVFIVNTLSAPVLPLVAHQPIRTIGVILGKS